MQSSQHHDILKRMAAWSTRFHPIYRFVPHIFYMALSYLLKKCQMLCRPSPIIFFLDCIADSTAAAAATTTTTDVADIIIVIVVAVAIAIILHFKNLVFCCVFKYKLIYL